MIVVPAFAKRKNSPEGISRQTGMRMALTICGQTYGKTIPRITKMLVDVEQPFICQTWPRLARNLEI